MIHPLLGLLVAAGLAGAGVHGLLARRHPLLVLLGVQLLLAAGAMSLAAGASLGAVRGAESLAVVLLVLGALVLVLGSAAVLLTHRVRGRIDLTDVGPDGLPVADAVDDTIEPEDEAQQLGGEQRGATRLLSADGGER